MSRKKMIGIISPASEGSLGDQAMLDVVRKACADDGAADLRILYRRKDTAHSLRGPYRQRRYVMTSKPGVMAAQDLVVTRNLDDLWCIGADIIDGIYNAKEVAGSLRFLQLMTRSGRRAGVLGASISERANQEIMATIGADPKIRFLARDSLSAQRFEKLAGRPAEQVADLAFLLEPEISSKSAHCVADWISTQKQHGRHVMAVNVAGKAFNDAAGGVAAQVVAYRKWLDADNGRAILFFPHDLREHPVGDEAALKEIYDALKNDFAERLHLWQAPFDAWDVKAVLGMVDSVVTQRMHGAIAALGAGKAPLCIVYQGKFEGLMSFFDLSDLCLPQSILQNADQFSDALTGYTQAVSGAHSKVVNNIAKVRALSQRNLDALLS